MKRKLSAGILAVAIAQIALADSAVQQAQETLKEQGFYYGQITGEKDADTTAAIRRFQIRKGLSVTGELNQETLKALDASTSSGATTTVEAATPAPQPNDSRDDSAGETVTRISPNAPPVRDGQVFQTTPSQPGSVIFGRTPYEVAPPELQRRVVLGAETLLRRRGFYRGTIDGEFGPQLEFALRAYQSSTGIPPSGRLDMDTLASLGLLPGQHMPIGPRRRVNRFAEPPVRGEWVH